MLQVVQSVLPGTCGARLCYCADLDLWPSTLVRYLLQRHGLLALMSSEFRTASPWHRHREDCIAGQSAGGKRASLGRSAPHQWRAANLILLQQGIKETDIGRAFAETLREALEQYSMASAQLVEAQQASPSGLTPAQVSTQKVPACPLRFLSAIVGMCVCRRRP